MAVDTRAAVGGHVRSRYGADLRIERAELGRATGKCRRRQVARRVARSPRRGCAPRPGRSARPRRGSARARGRRSAPPPRATLVGVDHAHRPGAPSKSPGSTSGGSVDTRRHPRPRPTTRRRAPARRGARSRAAATTPVPPLDPASRRRPRPVGRRPPRPGAWPRRTPPARAAGGARARPPDRRVHRELGVQVDVRRTRDVACGVLLATGWPAHPVAHVEHRDGAEQRRQLGGRDQR